MTFYITLGKDVTTSDWKTDVSLQSQLSNYK